MNHGKKRGETVQKLEKGKSEREREREREEERKIQIRWNESRLIGSKNFNTETNTNTDPPNKTRFDETKSKVYEIWFGGMSLESV